VCGDGRDMAISFQGAQAPSLTVLEQVRSYWQGLRQGSAPPLREALDPRGMAQALESSFLLERIAPGLARFRIAGMNLHDLIGLDARGMPLSTLFDPPARARMAAVLESVFAAPAVGEIWLQAECGIGRPTLEGRMLLLPVRDAQGQTSMALGCLALAGSMGRAPRRFAVTRTLCAAISPLAASQSTKTAAQSDLADPSAVLPLPALGKIVKIRPTHRAASHLRLVYSRD